MGHCIFCLDKSDNFTTREHILPESLGGGDWAVLPEALFCDVCQNRFGSEIEQQALSDYPFSLFRVLLGIPTKKGRPPWFKSWEGIVRASPQPGTIEFDPALSFKYAITNGLKSQMRILAHPVKPHMACRFLLKMGIEIIAADNPCNVFLEKFDAARMYALTGNKTVPWWYLQCENMEEATRFISHGVTQAEWHEGIKLEVLKLNGRQEILHVRLLYVDFMVPLTANIEPQLEELSEPHFRLFRV